MNGKRQIKKALRLYTLTGLLLLICAVILSFSLLHHSPAYDACNCQPVSHPYRAQAKHDTTLKDLPQRKTLLTVEEMRGWEKKYPIDLLITENAYGRISHTPEDTVYTLEAWLYAVKIKADCDLHLQVGPENPNKPRVVIEIPKEECALQNELLGKIRYKPGQTDIYFNKGLHILAKGPAFFDGNNRGRPGKKRIGGCTWELHPVKSIVFK